MHALRNPSLQELTRAVQTQQPSLLYLSSGLQVVDTNSGIDNISLRPLEFKDTKGDHPYPPASPQQHDLSKCTVQLCA